MDTSVLDSVVSVEASVVTSVSKMSFSDSVVVVSVDANVVSPVVSTACFSVVIWALVGRSTSMFSVSVALVVCTGDAVPSVSFSVRTAMEVSSTMASVVGLPDAATSTFPVASLIGSVSSASIFLETVITGA